MKMDTTSIKQIFSSERIEKMTLENLKEVVKLLVTYCDEFGELTATKSEEQTQETEEQEQQANKVFDEFFASKFGTPIENKLDVEHDSLDAYFAEKFKQPEGYNSLHW